MMFVMPSEAPILAVWVGAEGKVLQLAMDLRKEGVFATPVVYPAVAFGHTLIRTSYMASHTREDIEVILHAFDKLADKYGLRKRDMPQDPADVPVGDFYNLDSLFD